MNSFTLLQNQIFFFLYFEKIIIELNLKKDFSVTRRKIQVPIKLQNISNIYSFE